MNKIYKLVFKSYGEILQEDYFFHKENALKEAYRLIARAMGLRRSETRNAEIYGGYKIAFFDPYSKKMLKDIYIDVIKTNDEV